MQITNSPVSVVIPATGTCDYIGFCLESVVASQHKPLEVIVIDDGLSKNALEKLISFAKEVNLIILKNQGNGLVDALNTGIKYSKGKYVARIDADDIVLPNRFDTQIKILDDNDDINVVASNVIYIDSSGFTTGQSDYPTGVLNQNPDFKTRCLISHPSTMYRRQDAIEIGLYRKIMKWKNIQIAEDFDFWLRMKNKGKILVIEEPLIKYRQHQNQVSIKNARGQFLGTLFVAAQAQLRNYEINELVIEKIFSFKLLKMLWTILKGLGISFLLTSFKQIFLILLRK